MNADFQTFSVAERYRQWLRDSGYWYASITMLPRGYRVSSGNIKVGVAP